MKKYNDILADERPEFKAANYGFDTLSNTELLSMVINRGAGTTESLSQARQLMNIADGSLSNLAKLSIDEMQVVQGIGDCKALAVLAAIELGKRRALERMPTKPDLGSSLAIRGSSRGLGQLPQEKSLTYTAPVSRGNCLRA